MKIFYTKLVFYFSFIINQALSQSISSILHIPPSSVYESESLNIEAIYDGDSIVENVILYHRIVGQFGFQELYMENNLVSWNATILSQFIDQKGLEYLIVFNFNDGSSIAYPKSKPFESPKNM